MKIYIGDLDLYNYCIHYKVKPQDELTISHSIEILHDSLSVEHCTDKKSFRLHKSEISEGPLDNSSQAQSYTHTHTRPRTATQSHRHTQED